MNISAFVGSQPHSVNVSAARADGPVAMFAGLGTSLILAAAVLVFGRRRPHPVFSAERVRTR